MKLPDVVKADQLTFGEIERLIFGGYGVYIEDDPEDRGNRGVVRILNRKTGALLMRIDFGMTAKTIFLKMKHEGESILECLLNS